MASVIGIYTAADGTPDSGLVELRPAVSATDVTPDPRVITQAPVTCVLDAAGAVAVEVLASDDDGWRLDGDAPMPYLVTERLRSGTRSWQAFFIGPGPHDLALLRQQPPAPSCAVPVPIPGIQGPQGEVAVVPDAITGAPGSQVVVRDLDDSPHRALLEFEVPEGMPGQAATIEIADTTTGAPGSPADVVNTGDPQHAVLGFVVPEGQPGGKGDQGEVEFLPALTGAPGSDVILVDHDPSPHRALIQLTVPEGMPGAPGPAIGGILTTKGDLAGRDAATAVRVPVGGNATVLEADSTAAAGVKWGAAKADKATVGNLLTDNQASGTDTLGNTTGWNDAANCTMASSATQVWQGAKSLALTVTANLAPFAVYTPLGTAGVPVVPGQVYTAHLRIWGPASGRVVLRYYNGASVISSTDGNYVTGSAWNRSTASVTAPATATHATIYYRSEGVAAGSIVYLDGWGFWKGAGGDWAMPGTPITGTQSAWEQVTLLADLPATGNWLGRKIQVTSGLGLQVMVWTGTAWAVSPESDTGWYNLTPANGTATTFAVNRAGNRVTLRINSITGTGTIYTLPVGWRSMMSHRAPFTNGSTQLGQMLINWPGGAMIPVSLTASTGEGTWTTAEAWPTTPPA